MTTRLSIEPPAAKSRKTPSSPFLIAEVDKTGLNGAIGFDTAEGTFPCSFKECLSFAIVVYDPQEREPVGKDASLQPLHVDIMALHANRFTCTKLREV